jgi:hypothetical protein
MLGLLPRYSRTGEGNELEVSSEESLLISGAPLLI